MATGRWWISLIAVFFTALLGVIWWLSLPDMKSPEGERAMKGAALAGMFTDKGFGGPYSLVNQDGRLVNSADFPNVSRLLYFGFTYCPDVCPSALSRISGAVDILGRRGIEIQPVFISIDPQRDSAPVLAEYLSHFNPRFIGLTGSPGQLAPVLEKYRIFTQKKEGVGGAPYLFDHTSFIFFVAPDDRVVGVFEAGLGPQKIADAISANLE